MDAMLKMIAKMAGVTEEQIMTMINQFQELTVKGVAHLESIENRLAAIEAKLSPENNEATIFVLKNGHEGDYVPGSEEN